MKRVNVSELKAKLSQYLRGVRQGHEVLVLDHNLPVARLMAVPQDQALAFQPESLSAREVFGNLPALRGKRGEGNSLDILLADRARR